MLAHHNVPKATMRVWRMLMHLSLGHVTLLGKRFQPPKFPPPIRLTAPGGLTLASYMACINITNPKSVGL